MKVMTGIIIGAVIGIAMVVFGYFYVGGFTNNSSNVLGKAQTVAPVNSNVAAKGDSNNATNNVESNSANKNKVSSNNNDSTTQGKGATNNTTTKLDNTVVNGNNSNPANFDVLLKGPYIYGTIAGNSPVLISLNHPNISNGVMTLNEYYPKVLSETFQLKVVSPKADQFIMYEYFDGKHTGTYNVVLNQGQLSGTFTHEGNGVVSQVTLGIFGGGDNGFIGSTPFLKGNIGNSPVVICTGGVTNNQMTEFYPNNPQSVFNIKQDYRAQNQNNANGEQSVVLDESYNGVETGVYNGVESSNGEITGTYTKLSNGDKIPFTLYPSYSN